MTDIDPAGNPDYLYHQVAGALAARIQAGRYVGGRLPGERQLAGEFGVSYQTQRHAMALLRDSGLIITRHGRGSFLAPDPGGTENADQPSPPGPAPASP